MDNSETLENNGQLRNTRKQLRNTENNSETLENNGKTLALRARVFTIVFSCLDYPGQTLARVVYMRRNRMFWFTDLNRISNQAYRNRLDFACVIKIFEEDH